MQERKLDRRIQRTQHQLRQALISLILEKGYEAITVQDILDRANMGRSTFYAHFRDKEDLLLSGFQVQMEVFRTEYLHNASLSEDPSKIGRELSLFFFRHAAEHRGIFKAMMGEKGVKVIMDQSQKLLAGLFREHFQEYVEEQQIEVPVDLLAHFIASSFLSLLTWWLDHDLPYTPEQMDAIYQRLVFPGVHTMFSRAEG